jgi:hypothetical protein
MRGCRWPGASPRRSLPRSAGRRVAQSLVAARTSGVVAGHGRGRATPTGGIEHWWDRHGSLLPIAQQDTEPAALPALAHRGGIAIALSLRLDDAKASGSSIRRPTLVRGERLRPELGDARLRARTEERAAVREMTAGPPELHGSQHCRARCCVPQMHWRRRSRSRAGGRWHLASAADSSRSCRPGDPQARGRSVATPAGLRSVAPRRGAGRRGSRARARARPLRSFAASARARCVPGLLGRALGTVTVTNCAAVGGCQVANHERAAVVCGAWDATSQPSPSSSA